MVSNEKPEDQDPKDALGSEVVIVMRLLQKLLALTLGQLYKYVCHLHKFPWITVSVL